MEGLQDVVAVLADGFEAAGVGVMVLGALASVVLTLRERGRGRLALYTAYRQRLGRSILLGLEFLVAADILRTTSDVPTLEDVVVLGAVVLIRTFLSFSLEVELEGRWPWQKHPPGAARPAGDG